MAGILYSLHVSSHLLPATGNTADLLRIQGCYCQYSLSCLSSNSVQEYGRRYLEYVCPSTLHVSLSPPIHDRLQSRYSHRGKNRVVELNIAIIVCSVPGLAKFFRTYVATWTLVQSLRSRLSKLGRSTTPGTPGSSPPEKHAWPAAHHRAPDSLTDEEAGLKQPSPVTSHDSEVGRTHGDVQMTERWQVHSDTPEVRSDVSVFDPSLVDPYLDTAGPEYSWLHTSGHDNIVSGMGSPDNNSGFQSARGHQMDMGK